MDQPKTRVYTDAQGRVCIDITSPWYVLNPSEGSLLEYAGPLLVVENKVMRLKDKSDLDSQEWVYAFALGVTDHEWKNGKETPLASLIEAGVTDYIGYRRISVKAPQSKPSNQVMLQTHLLAMELTTGTNFHIRELALRSK